MGRLAGGAGHDRRRLDGNKIQHEHHHQPTASSPGTMQRGELGVALRSARARLSPWTPRVTSWRGTLSPRPSWATSPSGHHRRETSPASGFWAAEAWLPAARSKTSGRRSRRWRAFAPSPAAMPTILACSGCSVSYGGQFALLPAVGRRSSRRAAHQHENRPPPEFGAIELDCDVLHLPDTDPAPIVYPVGAGGEAASSLALLRVVARQCFTHDPIDASHHSMSVSGRRRFLLPVVGAGLR